MVTALRWDTEFVDKPDWQLCLLGKKPDATRIPKLL